jgi:Flp pilus assembly protein TadG
MWKRFNSCQKGAAAVEFAIIILLLMIITFGIIEFGLIIYDKQMITNASREGARAGIVAGTTRLPKTGTPSITSVVNDYCSTYLISLGSNSSPTTDATVSGSTTTIADAKFGDKLTVTVSYDYSFLVMTNLLPGLKTKFPNNKIKLNAVTIMVYE